MKLECFTVDELVARFVETALAQDRAEQDDNIRLVNRLFGELENIEAELKGRHGDMRARLFALYGYPNMHVRLKSALATLAVAPQKARAMLEQIRTSGHYPQALEAGMMARSIDDGSYKPT